jgi:hypothetical protein
MMDKIDFILRVAAGWFLGALLYSLTKEIVRTLRQGYRIAVVYSVLSGKGKRPKFKAWMRAAAGDFMRYYSEKGIGPYWIPHDGKSRITARR